MNFKDGERHRTVPCLLNRFPWRRVGITIMKNKFLHIGLFVLGVWACISFFVKYIESAYVIYVSSKVSIFFLALINATLILISFFIKQDTKAFLIIRAIIFWGIVCLLVSCGLFVIIGFWGR